MDKIVIVCDLFSGLRVVDADRHAGDAPRRERDGPRLHVRDAKAATDDHVGRWQGAHPGVNVIKLFFLRL
jgi:hypothetical protein